MAEKEDVDRQLENVVRDLSMADWKDKYRRLNEKYKFLLAEHQELQDKHTLMLGLQDQIKDTVPIKMKVRPTGRPTESVAVLMASDWHLEERVDPATVNGVNEYTPEIAEQRVKKFFENGLSMVNMCRTRSRIDKLILAVLGDLITNTIHDDLMEGNYLSPGDAIMKAYAFLCGGIDFLLAEGQFEEILIPCNYGNHGRTTKKIRIATAAKNSFEWLMYQFAAQRYANEPRVRFQISEGYHTYVEVYNTKMRMHHGNGINYFGGVGGVTIPLNKAIAQWNKIERVDIDCLAHWHTMLHGKDYMINGSVIGFNSYSIQIKASFEEPQQTLFLVHPERGRTVIIPIDCKAERNVENVV